MEIPSQAFVCSIVQSTFLASWASIRYSDRNRLSGSLKLASISRLGRAHSNDFLCCATQVGSVHFCASCYRCNARARHELDSVWVHTVAVSFVCKIHVLFLRLTHVKPPKHLTGFAGKAGPEEASASAYRVPRKVYRYVHGRALGIVG